MSPVLPVSMLPAIGQAAKPTGFVVAVLIGLALFAAAKVASNGNTNNSMSN